MKGFLECKPKPVYSERIYAYENLAMTCCQMIWIRFTWYFLASLNENLLYDVRATVSQCRHPFDYLIWSMYYHNHKVFMICHDVLPQYAGKVLATYLPKFVHFRISIFLCFFFFASLSVCKERFPLLLKKYCRLSYFINLSRQLSALK